LHEISGRGLQQDNYLSTSPNHLWEVAENFYQSDRSADRIMNPGPPEKKSGNIMFCENYWKHTTCKCHYKGLFQKGRQCHTLQYVTAIFHFFPQWKLSRIITASSGVWFTFTEQFCGKAHWNLVTRANIYWSLQSDTQTAQVL